MTRWNFAPNDKQSRSGRDINVDENDVLFVGSRNFANCRFALNPQHIGLFSAFRCRLFKRGTIIETQFVHRTTVGKCTERKREREKESGPTRSSSICPRSKSSRIFHTLRGTATYVLPMFHTPLVHANRTFRESFHACTVFRPLIGPFFEVCLTFLSIFLFGERMRDARERLGNASLRRWSLKNSRHPSFIDRHGEEKRTKREERIFPTDSRGGGATRIVSTAVRAIILNEQLRSLSIPSRLLLLSGLLAFPVNPRSSSNVSINKYYRVILLLPLPPPRITREGTTFCHSLASESINSENPAFLRKATFSSARRRSQH